MSRRAARRAVRRRELYEAGVVAVLVLLVEDDAAGSFEPDGSFVSLVDDESLPSPPEDDSEDLDAAADVELDRLSVL